MRQNFSGFCMEEFPQYKAYNNGLGNLTTVELISFGYRYRYTEECGTGTSDIQCDGGELAKYCQS